MDESLPAKRFKSNKMINRATSGSEAPLHISEQFVRFKIPDKSTVDHSFHGFTDGIGITIYFLQSEGKSPDNHILLKNI